MFAFPASFWYTACRLAFLLFSWLHFSGLSSSFKKLVGGDQDRWGFTCPWGDSAAQGSGAHVAWGGCPPSRAMTAGRQQGRWEPRGSCRHGMLEAKRGEKASWLRAVGLVTGHWFHARGTCPKIKYIKDDGSHTSPYQSRRAKGKTRMVSVMRASN